MKEGRFVNHLDPKAVGDLSVRLRKKVEAMTEQCTMGFDPHEVLTIGNKHRQKHDPIWGQVVYQCVMVSEEISDKPVDGHPESMVEEVNEGYNLTEIGGGHILAKGTPVTRKLPWRQEPPNHKILDVLLRRRHLPWRTKDRTPSPLLFELISSSPTELMLLVFLARVFLGAMNATTESEI